MEKILYHYHIMNESKASYQKVLAKTGFENIYFRDDSSIFLDYTKTASAKILQNRDFLKREFGEETYTMVYNYNQKLLEDIMLHRNLLYEFWQQRSRKQTDCLPIKSLPYCLMLFSEML